MWTTKRPGVRAVPALVQVDHETAATHPTDASALAARMDTGAAPAQHLWFGVTNVGIWRTSLAVEPGEYGQAVRAAQAVHPELLPSTTRRATFWVELGRALLTSKKTRERACACCCTLNCLPPADPSRRIRPRSNRRPPAPDATQGRAARNRAG